MSRFSKEKLCESKPFWESRIKLRAKPDSYLGAAGKLSLENYRARRLFLWRFLILPAFANNSAQSNEENMIYLSYSGKRFLGKKAEYKNAIQLLSTFSRESRDCLSSKKTLTFLGKAHFSPQNQPSLSSLALFTFPYFKAGQRSPTGKVELDSFHRNKYK